MAIQTMAEIISSEDLSLLNASAPEDLLTWAHASFGTRAGIFTSFQKTGCVLIDMAHRAAPDLRVITVDTLRLPKETYAFMARIAAHYDLAIERFTPDPAHLERMIRAHGEYLFFDNPAKQEYCCKVRKVEPNQRALATVDVWITGLRRDQSAARQRTPKADVVHRGGRPIIKLCPLADWDEEHVQDYIRSHGVPCNRLYEQGYTSIGCEICTTPTLPWEDLRAGRWRWQNQAAHEHAKECGIHVQGGGI